MYSRRIVPAVCGFFLVQIASAQEPSTVPAPEPAAPAPISIEIDLTSQKAWVLQDGQKVYETSISSGRTGHETPPGNFAVLEKDADHKSSLYGRILDGAGRVVISDADCDTPVPAGAKFVQAPMKHFLRIDGPVGMHAGRLPGYPASHGCVRLPPSKAKLFFDIAEIGTPVRVFGKAPRTGPPDSPRKSAKALPTPAPTPEPRGWFSWFKNQSK
jgi:lipoprotein-anchoring transpeptidase ErfK/SrfK